MDEAKGNSFKGFRSFPYFILFTQIGAFYLALNLISIYNGGIMKKKGLGLLLETIYIF